MTEPCVRHLPELGYLVPEFPAQTHAFFWREIQALRLAGITVHLFSTRRPPSNPCLHDFAPAAQAETHYLFPPRLFGSAAQLLRHPGRLVAAIRYIFRLSESSWRSRLNHLPLILCAADLVRWSAALRIGHVHIHSCATAAHLGALAHLLGGPTYSLTLHGDLPVYGTDHAHKMARAVVVSCVTRPLREQVRRATGLPDEQLPVVWMGVNTDAFRLVCPRPKGVRCLKLLTVARLNVTKGHVYALQALREAIDRGCDLVYEIVGEGPHRAEIEAEVARLQLSDRVSLVGTLGEAEVLDRLRKADVFVLPSFGFGEAAPVSVMEAMACELPVVASVIGGTPDMITDGTDGILVTQCNVRALADAFVRLHADPTLCERLGRAARARAVDQFDYKRTAGALCAAIAAALSVSHNDSPTHA